MYFVTFGHNVALLCYMAAVSIDTQIKNVRDSIKKRTLAPIYLLKGEEPYYIDIISNEFEKHLIDDSARDFNLDVLYGKDASAQMLIGACRQYPMMTDLRLVLFKEAQMMDKKEWSAFMMYLKNPQPSTVLVICFKKNYDASGKGFDVTYKNAIVKSKGVIIESEKIKDYNIPKWINNYIASKSFTTDERCVNMLSEYLGNNLQKIANEIDKLIINIKDRKNITQDDIANYIGISKDYNVFELQNALSRKNVLKANQIISYFEKNPKENPLPMIIPVLFGYFTKLLIASQIPLKNTDTVAQALNTSPYFAKDYLSALNYYSGDQLLKIITLFNEYDLKSKGIGTSPLTTDGALLKELVYKILHT